jgi:DNA-binding NtrC family response regulator
MSERLLIVDDELFVRELLQEMCNSLGYEVSTSGCANNLAGLMAQHEFSAALVDLKPSDCRGLAVIRQLQDLTPDLPVVVMTGQPNIDDLIAAMRLGALDCVVKPFRRREIADILARACADSRRRNQIRALRERVAELEARAPGAERRSSRRLVIPRKRDLVETTGAALEFMESIRENRPEDLRSMSATGGSGSGSGK